MAVCAWQCVEVVVVGVTACGLFLVQLQVTQVPAARECQGKYPVGNTWHPFTPVVLWSPVPVHPGPW